MCRTRIGYGGVDKASRFGGGPFCSRLRVRSWTAAGRRFCNCPQGANIGRPGGLRRVCGARTGLTSHLLTGYGLSGSPRGIREEIAEQEDKILEAISKPPRASEST